MQEQTQYLIPTGRGDGTIPLDVVKIVEAETRLAEVATVTAQQSNELLAFYNEIWLEIDKTVKRLTLEKNLAEHALSDALDEALLNCTDEEIEKRGHKRASADLRKAIANQSPMVKACRDRLLQITTVISYLAGKREAFYRAHGDVKNLRDGGNLSRLPLHGGNAPKAMQGPGQAPAQDLQGDDPWSTDKGAPIDDYGFGGRY